VAMRANKIPVLH